MPFESLLEENKPLAPYTTLGMGGAARWFVEATQEEQVVEAASWARERDIKLFVMGGGSNLVVSDAGFDGLVLRIGLRGMHVEDARDGSGQKIYRVAAGEDWEQFVQRTVEDGCAGIECLAGIPGTVGGTPVQNVGAYGQEVASTIEQVRAFDLRERAWLELTAAECGFAYRRSRFNTHDRGRYVVTRVDYRLTPGGEPTLQYADIRRLFAPEVKPSVVEVTAAVRRVRQAKGMLLVEGDPDCRSAGSFFKNPVVTEERATRIAESCGKEPPLFPAGTGAENAGTVKVPAAWLIEQAGFTKGFVMGAVGISSRHTLALINRGGATAEELMVLAERIRDAVRARFGVALEMEPVLLGFR